MPAITDTITDLPRSARDAGAVGVPAQLHELGRGAIDDLASAILADLLDVSHFAAPF
jgi:hypothetical protein